MEDTTTYLTNEPYHLHGAAPVLSVYLSEILHRGEKEVITLCDIC